MAPRTPTKRHPQRVQTSRLAAWACLGVALCLLAACESPRAADGRIAVGVQAVVAGATGVRYQLSVEQPQGAGGPYAALVAREVTSQAGGSDDTYVATCVPGLPVRVTVTLLEVQGVGGAGPLPQTQTRQLAQPCQANADLRASFDFQLQSSAGGERGFVDAVITVVSEPVHVTAKLDCVHDLYPDATQPDGRADAAVFGLAADSSLYDLVLVLDPALDRQLYTGVEVAPPPFRYLNAAMRLPSAASLSGAGLWLPRGTGGFFAPRLPYVAYAGTWDGTACTSRSAAMRTTVVLGGGAVTPAHPPTRPLYLLVNDDPLFAGFRILGATAAAMNEAASPSLSVWASEGVSAGHSAAKACYHAPDPLSFDVLSLRAASNSGHDYFRWRACTLAGCPTPPESADPGDFDREPEGEPGLCR